MANNSVETIVKYKDKTQRILVMYDSINQRLRENNFRKLSEGGNPIEDLIMKGNASNDIWLNFRDLANIAYDLSIMIEDNFEQARLEHAQEMEHERDKNWEIRKNLWKLWVEKYIRWVIGLGIAIFLYSAFTYYTQDSSFWKIPIKATIEKFAPH